MNSNGFKEKLLIQGILEDLYDFKNVKNITHELFNEKKEENLKDRTCGFSNEVINDLIFLIMSSEYPEYDNHYPHYKWCYLVSSYGCAHMHSWVEDLKNKYSNKGLKPYDEKNLLEEYILFLQLNWNEKRRTMIDNYIKIYRFIFDNKLKLEEKGIKTTISSNLYYIFFYFVCYFSNNSRHEELKNEVSESLLYNLLKESLSFFKEKGYLSTDDFFKKWLISYSMGSLSVTEKIRNEFNLTHYYKLTNDDMFKKI